MQLLLIFEKGRQNDATASSFEKERFAQQGILVRENIAEFEEPPVNVSQVPTIGATLYS